MISTALLGTSGFHARSYKTCTHEIMDLEAGNKNSVTNCFCCLRALTQSRNKKILGFVLLVKCPWTPFVSLNSWFFGKQTQLKAAAIAVLCVALSIMFLSTFSTLCPRLGLTGVP